MMLVLALRTSPEMIYQEALGLFSPEEIAEAFAATRGITVPSQLLRSAKTAAIWSAPSGRWRQPGHPSAFSDGASAASP